MAGYSELIKNFEKIRDFTRDFFIYGFRGRGDYRSVSARSYDNERRRIESYLSEHIVKIHDSKGKRISISSNTTGKTSNPLFKIWQTKSFTKWDCFLHFVILDILSDSKSLCVNDIADIISCDYALDMNPEPVDTMTIRNKLNEYTGLGMLNAEKQGKTLYYSLNQNLLSNLKPETKEGLDIALGFYKNLLPGGFIGHSINRTSDNPFIYRQIFFSQVLDDEVLVQVLRAINDKKSVLLNIVNTKSKSSVKSLVVPLMVLSNTRTGRKYVGVYSLRKHRYSTIRLDYIKDVELLDIHTEYESIKNKYRILMKNSFSIMNKSEVGLQNVRMLINIDEVTEQYVLDRIKREGRHGALKRVDKNVFEYTIDVADTLEMVPWLRTFIGRIIDIEGTEQGVISQFKRDIKTMVSMYDS